MTSGHRSVRQGIFTSRFQGLFQAAAGAHSGLAAQRAPSSHGTDEALGMQKFMATPMIAVGHSACSPSFTTYRLFDERWPRLRDDAEARASRIQECRLGAAFTYPPHSVSSFRRPRQVVTH